MAGGGEVPPRRRKISARMNCGRGGQIGPHPQRTPPLSPPNLQPLLFASQALIASDAGDEIPAGAGREGACAAGKDVAEVRAIGRAIAKIVINGC